MSVGWKTLPTPAPTTDNIAAMAAGCVSLFNINASPAPLFDQGEQLADRLMGAC